MPERKFEQPGASYRYSINGQEKERELNENITTALYWEYDSRIGRRWNVDPVSKMGLSNYSAFNNNPNLFADPNGADTIRFNRTTVVNKSQSQWDGHSDHLYVKSYADVQSYFDIEVITAQGKDVYEWNTTNVTNGVCSKKTVYLDPFSDNRAGLTKGKNVYFDGLITTERNNYDWESIGKIMNTDKLFYEYMINRVPQSSNWRATALSYSAMEGVLPVLTRSLMASWIGWRYLSGSNSSFTIEQAKYDYFLGRVTSSTTNAARSAQNLKDLTTLGVNSESQLMNIFNQAFEKGVVASTKTTQFGTTIMKTVNVGDKGSISVGFFYQGGKMCTIPKITTIIPKIFK